MYQIHFAKKPDTKVEINLDRIPQGKVPKHIIFGVGDKAKFYKNYLEKSFKDNTELLRFLTYIHLQGCKLGDVALITNPKLRLPYHAKCVKDFLIEHQEVLSHLVPYLYPGEKVEITNPEATLDPELKEKLEKEGYTPMDTSTSAKTLGDLPEVDRNQIMALIQADQALNKPQDTPTNVDETAAAVSGQENTESSTTVAP